MKNIEELKSENLRLKEDLDFIHELLEIEKMKREYLCNRVKKLQKQLEGK